MMFQYIKVTKEHTISHPPDMPAASHGVPQLQMELVRSCMVDVLEEFQDEMNSRLIHLQYIITKKFIQQQVSVSVVADFSTTQCQEWT